MKKIGNVVYPEIGHWSGVRCVEDKVREEELPHFPTPPIGQGFDHVYAREHRGERVSFDGDGSGADFSELAVLYDFFRIPEVITEISAGEDK